ncbi:MAG: cobalamin B12-binding domain-containing protein [Candidatus Humimicrobiaceae bacterium]
MNEVMELVIAGEDKKLSILIKEQLNKGESPNAILSELTEGMKKVGDLYQAKEIYLPEMIIAAEAFKNVMPLLEDKLAKDGGNKKLGKIIIATVKGDVHDIGKNLVATMLRAGGFEVLDIGEDVPAESIIISISEQKPDVVALSTLLSIGLYEIKNTIDEIIKNNLRHKVKIIVGGPPLDAEVAKKIGADGYGDSAASAVDIAKKVLNK